MTRWLVVVLAAAAAVTSCFVDRRSGDFECERDADCDDIPGDPRECTNNVCVVMDCPSICDSCTSTVCTINCNNAAKCANLECPNGFSCNLSCSQDCRNLECDDGCTVSCSANADCGPIDCGLNETCNCTATGNGTCL